MKMSSINSELLAPSQAIGKGTCKVQDVSSVSRAVLNEVVSRRGQEGLEFNELGSRWQHPQGDAVTTLENHCRIQRPEKPHEVQLVLLPNSTYQSSLSPPGYH